MKLAPIRRGLQTELESVLSRLAALDIAPSRAAEDLDAIAEAEANEATVRLRADLRAKAARIGVALARIAEGRYGICSTCGQHIRPGRLKAIPDAERCLECQTAAERDELRRVPHVTQGDRLDEDPA